MRIFSTNSFNFQPASTIPQNEKEKIDAEFKKYAEEFEAEKEKFRKEHPEKAQQGPDPSRLYEDTMERELRLIYEGQNTIHRVVAQLDAKLNQIIQSQQQLAGKFSFF